MPGHLQAGLVTLKSKEIPNSSILIQMEITLITDFYGAFLTKVPSNPYNSGFDLTLLGQFFEKQGIHLTIKKYSDFQFFENYSNKLIIYTSIEDPGGNYRSYIDDVLYGLEQSGAILLPEYKYFKAHENKVFMEILRNIIFKEDTGMTSYKLGSYSDFETFPVDLKFPVVVKKSSGSASKGVYLTESKRILDKTLKRISNTCDYRSLLMDFFLVQKKRIRQIKYINRYSLFRKKFILQNFINDLPNDYKVLIFGSRYYVLKRYNRDNDFRASGSGKFVTSDEFKVSDGLLDSCERWFNNFNVPCASFDVACKDNRYYLLEFQFVSFGTYTQTSAKSYNSKNKDNKWENFNKLISLEEVYADSIAEYLGKNYSGQITGNR
jgi:glutathione synthase/RimK-type ligase-like ATP-grasp enzyme